MTVVVYATQTEVESAPVRSSLTLRLLGVDGSAWVLSDQPGGIIMRKPGPVGLLLPAFTDYVSTSPDVDGQRHRGTRLQPRRVSLPVALLADSSAGWLARWRSWWKAWDPDQPATLEVWAEGQVRRLKLRLTGDGDDELVWDPVARRILPFTVEAIADRPYWTGDPIVASWSTGSVRNFLNPGGFDISPSSTTAGATMDNPGDAATWPTWTATAGPSGLAWARLTMAGGTIELPAIPAGQTVVVATDPGDDGGAQMGTLAGGVFVASNPDIDALIDTYEARKVPPGAGIPVGIELSGEGSVSVSITPQYRMGL